MAKEFIITNMVGTELYRGEGESFKAVVEPAVATGAYLRDADLRGAQMPNGETWEQYLAEVVPALLTAGGKCLGEVLSTGCWECHDWSNCPMHAAFGIDNEDEGPALLRPRIREFVQLFDAGLIPVPASTEASKNG